MLVSPFTSTTHSVSPILLPNISFLNNLFKLTIFVSFPSAPDILVAEFNRFLPRILLITNLVEKHVILTQFLQNFPGENFESRYCPFLLIFAHQMVLLHIIILKGHP